MLADRDTSSFTNLYVYGNGIDEVLVMNDGTNDYFYLHDHLDSPVALLDDSGTVVERCEYNAYGKATIFDAGTDGIWFNANDDIYTSSQYGNPYTFTGRRLDVLDGGGLSPVSMYAYAINQKKASQN